MEITFDQQQSRRLFEDRSYAPDEMSTAVVRAFRMVVSFLIAAQRWSDVEAMRCFRTHPVGVAEEGWFSIDLVDPWSLRVQVQGDEPGTQVLVGELRELSVGGVL